MDIDIHNQIPFDSIRNEIDFKDKEVTDDIRSLLCNLCSKYVYLPKYSNIVYVEFVIDCGSIYRIHIYTTKHYRVDIVFIPKEQILFIVYQIYPKNNYICVLTKEVYNESNYLSTDELVVFEYCKKNNYLGNELRL